MSRHNDTAPVPGRRGTGKRSTRLRGALSRARFLGLLAGGGGAGWLALQAWGGLVNGWRFNTVENPIPAFDPQSFRLTIDGLVERPLTLSYDELRSLPAVRQISDFHCVEGWGVEDVRWDGVRMQSIADLVRPTDDAKFVTFHSLAGVYRDSLSLQQSMLPDVLLAYAMDGSPLTSAHGLPPRLGMPRRLGSTGS